MGKKYYVVDALEPAKFDRAYFKDQLEGGVGVVHASIGIWEDARMTLDLITQWYRLEAKNSDLIRIIYTSDDLDIVRKEGKLGIILGIQHSSAIGEDLSNVQAFARLGIKCMQLTYNNQNYIGCGGYEEFDHGISRFGKKVIQEMNRWGVLIDLSHCGRQTTLEAIELSERPVAITHSNADWLYPTNTYLTKRIKSKEVMASLRDHGGMFGLTLWPTLIGGSHTTLDEFCGLVADTADFMGIDRIGFGTDLIHNRDDEYMSYVREGRWTHDVDYGTIQPGMKSRPDWPEWFQGPKNFPNISEGLLKKGFSDEEVAGIMGENWFRFMKDAFKTNETLLSVR